MLTRPEATPDSATGALAIAVLNDGTKAKAMPAAATSDAGSTSTRYEPPGRAKDSHSAPAASSANPMVTMGSVPQRAARRGATTVMPITMSAVIGISAAPAAKAEAPSTFCRCRFRKNHIGIQAPPSSSWARLAPPRSGVRSRPGRSSGSAARSCRITNATRRATPTASGATVAASAQPASGARTIAKTVRARPAVPVTAPRTSMRPVLRGEGPNARGVSRRIASAIGTVT